MTDVRNKRKRSRAITQNITGNSPDSLRVPADVECEMTSAEGVPRRRKRRKVATSTAATSTTPPRPRRTARGVIQASQDPGDKIEELSDCK